MGMRNCTPGLQGIRTPRVGLIPGPGSSWGLGQGTALHHPSSSGHSGERKLVWLKDSYETAHLKMPTGLVETGPGPAHFRGRPPPYKPASFIPIISSPSPSQVSVPLSHLGRGGCGPSSLGGSPSGALISPHGLLGPLWCSPNLAEHQKLLSVTADHWVPRQN